MAREKPLSGRTRFRLESYLDPDAQLSVGVIIDVNVILSIEVRQFLTILELNRPWRGTRQAPEEAGKSFRTPAWSTIPLRRNPPGIRRLRCQARRPDRPIFDRLSLPSTPRPCRTAPSTAPPVPPAYATCRRKRDQPGAAGLRSPNGAGNSLESDLQRWRGDQAG